MLLRIIKTSGDYTRSILLTLYDFFCFVFNIKYKTRNRVNSTRFYRWIISITTKKLYGPAKFNTGKNQLIVVCLVRNGENYIDSFVKHYLNLGASSIVFLLNNTTDNSLNIISKYKNVNVYENNLPYKTYAWNFKPYLINRFAKNCWCLCVDIDEYFDYPYSDKINLPTFLTYLNNNSYNAVVCQMLDMFSNKPINQQISKNFNRKDYRYYDISNIKKSDLPGNNIYSNKKIKFYKGGIHSSIFGLADIYLTKYSLVFLDGKLTADDFRTHYIAKNAKIADISCVFFHYKLINGLIKKSEKAVIEKNYINESKQYIKYFTILKNNQSLNIFKKANNPHILNSLYGLLNTKFLNSSHNFSTFIRSTGDKHKNNS